MRIALNHIYLSWFFSTLDMLCVGITHCVIAKHHKTIDSQNPVDGNPLLLPFLPMPPPNVRIVCTATDPQIWCFTSNLCAHTHTPVDRRWSLFGFSLCTFAIETTFERRVILFNWIHPKSKTNNQLTHTHMQAHAHDTKWWRRRRKKKQKKRKLNTTELK